MKDFFDISIIWKKVNQKVSKQETNAIEDWIEDKSDRRDYAEKTYSYFETGPKIKTADIDVAKARQKVSYSVFIKPKIIKAYKVAAVLIGLVSMVFFLQYIGSKNQVSEHKVKIEPGKAKATIVLSDGSRHYLDEENPQAINEKGAIILNSGKKLDYKTESTSNILHLKQLESRYNTIKIPRGGEFFLSLSDGTKVWLNSETTITYPIRFGDKERKVELVGEAYFEVEHNSEKPFKVEIEGQVIEVLGTTFNVNAYTDERKTFTTLVTGSVKIDLDKVQDEILLTPGSQCEVNNVDKSYSISQVDVRGAIAWVNGSYMFDGVTLEEMMVTLSRWYDFTFNFERDNVRRLSFNGKLKRTDNFEDILTIIENTNEVKFKVKERNVIIY